MAEAREQINTTRRIMYLLHQVRAHTNEVVGNALADLGLTGTQALILETLLEEGPTSAAELGRRCLLTRQALSAPLNDLEKRSLVNRPRPDVSVRQRPSRLTDEGQRVAEIIRERVGALERHSRACMTASEFATFEDLLRRYAKSWADQTASPSPAADLTTERDLA